MRKDNKTEGRSGKFMRKAALMPHETGSAEFLGDGRTGFNPTYSSPETGE